MSSGKIFGLGNVGILLALLAVTASYFACLYGAELDQQSLAAFGVWSLAGIIVAFLVDMLFKVALILAVLFLAALIWTDNPAIQGPAAQAKALRATLCDKIPLDNPDVPVKDWIC
jgi:hypothetical protein